MSDFDFAIEKTLAIEGGYTVDHAGPTNRGIVLRALREMGAAADYDHDGDVDVDDLKSMSTQQAVEWYWVNFWIPGGWEKIAANMPAWKSFDCHVNMGLHQASLILQRALARCGRVLEIDGDAGPITFAEANATNPIYLLDSMRQEMRIFYERIIRNNPSFERYRAGWMERAAA